MYKIAEPIFVKVSDNQWTADSVFGDYWITLTSDGIYLLGQNNRGYIDEFPEFKIAEDFTKKDNRERLEKGLVKVDAETLWKQYSHSERIHGESTKVICYSRFISMIKALGEQ